MLGRSITLQPLAFKRASTFNKVSRSEAAATRDEQPFEPGWRSKVASAAEVVAAVKKQGLEGVIAKRRDSLYEPGRRSGAWVKMRINKGQELVIGGYVPSGKNFDSLIVGYYEGDDLIYIARVRSGFVPALRAKVFEGIRKHETKTCPFSNLPQRDKGRWG
jgi:ATP-dependent DNA ligase